MGILNELGFSTREKSFIYDEMQEERETDLKTYMHSMNVGKIMLNIAETFGLDKKIAIASGLLHDNGKMDISRDVLYKSDNFNKDDWYEMHKHPGYSYNRIRKTLPIIAEIAVRHHSEQGLKSYPKNLSDSSGKVLGFAISPYVTAIVLADFYEAITSENRTGDGRYDHVTGIKECMKFSHPKLKQEVNKLYENRVFAA